MTKFNPLANRKKKSFTEDVGTVRAYAAEENYEYIVDYSLLDTTEEENKQLMEFEKVIGHSAKKIGNELITIGEYLSRGQELLADHNGGTFEKWYSAMGFKKTWVYMQIKRFSLSDKYKNQEIGKLPEKVVTAIANAAIEFSREEIENVVTAKKPAAVLQEIIKEKESFGDRTTVLLPDEIEEAELVEEAELEADPDFIRLSEVKKEIRMLRARLNELEAEEKMLENKKK